MPVSRDELIFLLYKACVLYQNECPETRPDWVAMIAGANPKMIESAIEIARDTYSYDETGEI
jgi:hypothetical protein